MSGGELERRFTALDGIAVIICMIIGTGIFASPGVVLELVQQTGVMLVVWLLGGFLAILGGLCYAELGTAIPDTGGDYIYLYELHPVVGFAYIWAAFWCLSTGSQAVVALIFARYLGNVILPSLDDAANLDADYRIKLIAMASIVLTTILNVFGTGLAARVQNTFLVTKFFTLLFVCVMAVYSVFWGDTAEIAKANFEDMLYLPPADEITWESVTLYLASVGSALIASLWAYGGFTGLNVIAGEVKNPQKNIPISILVALVLVAACYVVANLAYLMVVPKETIISSQAIAVTLADTVWGQWAAVLTGLLVAISALGSLHTTTLGGSRLFYAAALNDTIPLSGLLRKVNTTYGTPHMSLLIQGVVAMVMLIPGTYESLLYYLGFTAWFYYAMCGVSLMWIRAKRPQYVPSFRVRPYPFVPVLFILISLGIVVSIFVSSPLPTFLATLFLFLAVPLYYCFYWRGNIFMIMYRKYIRSNEELEEESLSC